MAAFRILICFMFWSSLAGLIVPCLGQTTAVILPDYMQDNLTSEGGTADPGAAGEGARVMTPTSLLQIVGLRPGIPVQPSDFSGNDTAHTATVESGDDKNFTEDDLLEAKVAEVLRRLTHPDVSGESGIEGREYYGAYASRSALPRGKCLIAIIWEAAQPTTRTDELLEFLDDLQDNLWDMEDDLMDLMEDVMYSDLSADNYYYADELDDDDSDTLTNGTEPDYYPDDIPDIEDSDDFEGTREERQKDENDHLLLFAPWMN